jgi:hypothetical protein
MKGIYPTVVYALFFTSGIIIFFLVYSYTSNFVNEKEVELEEVQAEKICNFLKNMEGKNVEVELELGDYRIKNNPLRIIGISTNYCNLNTTTQGNCSKICKIKSSRETIVFS